MEVELHLTGAMTAPGQDHLTTELPKVGAPQMRQDCGGPPAGAGASQLAAMHLLDLTHSQTSEIKTNQYLNIIPLPLTSIIGLDLHLVLPSKYQMVGRF